MMATALFDTVKTELVKVNHWFKANKLSLNVKKTNYTFFNKPSIKGNIILKITELVISNKVMKRKRFTKFLGVILEECITWKDHIRTVQNKIAKI